MPASISPATIRSALALLSMRLACPLLRAPSSRTATMIRSPLGAFGRRFAALIPLPQSPARVLPVRADERISAKATALIAISKGRSGDESVTERSLRREGGGLRLDRSYWNVVSMRADASKKYWNVWLKR